MKNALYAGAAVLMLIFLADTSYCLDIMNLRDQSTLRCPGGIVARGNSELQVQQRCGDPLKRVSSQDLGPVWIYHFRGSRFMYYLTFLHGNLQRILSATCNPNRPECLRIR